MNSISINAQSVIVKANAVGPKIVLGLLGHGITLLRLPKNILAMGKRLDYLK
jgi:hypothetical protein